MNTTFPTATLLRVPRALARRVRSTIEHRRNPAQADSSGAILDAYVRSPPSAQNAVDLFDGEWSSAVPAAAEELIHSGVTPLFDDPRIRWAESVFGGFQGMRVLELGPLEGGHSFMLDRGGATSVDAIEANTRGYLKCLIVKEIVGLPSVRFHLGDFMPILDDPAAGSDAWRPDAGRFDLAVASGVLYHMENPVEMLAGLSALADRLFIWTQYLDPERLADLSDKGARFGALEQRTYGDLVYSCATQTYGRALGIAGFCGGPEQRSRWLTRQALFDALEYVGYTDLKVDFDEPDHPNGPAIAICASK